MDPQLLDSGRWTSLHPGRNRTKADLRLLEAGGRRYAVKDYRARSALVRATLGRWCLDREERAYRALAGLRGIPSLAGRPHPSVLILELVEGTSLAAWDRARPLPPGFFGRLKDLLRQVHARGVVQGDLHHRDVIVGRGGEAWLVDFSTSLSGGPTGLVRRSLWRLMARLDRRAVLKLQERFEPGTLTAEERRELRDEPWVSRLGRRLRRLGPGRGTRRPEPPQR